MQNVFSDSLPWQANIAFIVLSNGLRQLFQSRRSRTLAMTDDDLEAVARPTATPINAP